MNRFIFFLRSSVFRLNEPTTPMLSACRSGTIENVPSFRAPPAAVRRQAFFQTIRKRESLPEQIILQLKNSEQSFPFIVGDFSGMYPVAGEIWPQIWIPALYEKALAFDNTRLQRFFNSKATLSAKRQIADSLAAQIYLPMISRGFYQFSYRACRSRSLISIISWLVNSKSNTS